MLYSVLDTGNFFVIPGSPIDVWAAESYSETHSKSQLRKENGFDNDNMLVLVLGSSFFYNDLAWDYAVAMHDLEPVLLKYAGSTDVGFTSKFIFLCGNSSKEYSDALQVCIHNCLKYIGSYCICSFGIQKMRCQRYCTFVTFYFYRVTCDLYWEMRDDYH